MFKYVTRFGETILKIIYYLFRLQNIIRGACCGNVRTKHNHFIII